jgi:hypothetical protein
MSQSRTYSILEAITNVAVGWLLAILTQLLVFPVYGLSVTVAQNLQIGVVFTGVSLVRSYALRRLFIRFGRF